MGNVVSLLDYLEKQYPEPKKYIPRKSPEQIRKEMVLGYMKLLTAQIEKKEE